MEEELTKLKVVLVEVDMAKNYMAEQVKENDQKLQGSEKMVAKQAAEQDALKMKIAALEKVMF